MRDQYDECMCTSNEPNACSECSHVFDKPCCCVNNDCTSRDIDDEAIAIGIMYDFLANDDTAVTPNGDLYCTECGVILMPGNLSWNDVDHLRQPRCPFYMWRDGEPVSAWVYRAITNTLVAKDMTFAR